MAVDYNAQMLNYYPEIVKAIKDFQELIKTQSLEVEEMHEELTKLLANAYISTADEVTISKWEKFLGITPLEQGNDDLETWLSGRRDTILARLYFTEKLNTKSISDVVKIFTGGEALSYFRDGVIYVLISPPRYGKKYKFANVEQELQKKTPAHLILNVRQNYRTWGQAKDTYTTWGSVIALPNWEEVCYVVLDTTATSLMSLR